MCWWFCKWKGRGKGRGKSGMKIERVWRFTFSFISFITYLITLDISLLILTFFCYPLYFYFAFSISGHIHYFILSLEFYLTPFPLNLITNIFSKLLKTFYYNLIKLFLIFHTMFFILILIHSLFILIFP